MISNIPESLKETIIIIAAGNSVKDMDLKAVCERGYVIGVKNAAWCAPADIGVCMDRHWTEQFISFLKGKPWWLRKVPKDLEWEGLRKFKCNHLSNEFAEEEGTLNGGNSGYCAVNLAYQMRPKRIFLIGFDMTGEAYWYEPYWWVVNRNK